MIENTEEKDFLINEYLNLTQLMNTGWTLCYTVISGGVVLLLSLLRFNLEGLVSSTSISCLKKSG